MAAELNKKIEGMRNEYLTVVHALVEGQAKDPPVQTVK